MNIFTTHKLTTDYWPDKGYACFLVPKENMESKILKIIQELDPLEFKEYLPDTGFKFYVLDKNDYVRTEDKFLLLKDFNSIPKNYYGSFTLDLKKFYKKCKEENIDVVVLAEDELSHIWSRNKF